MKRNRRGDPEGAVFWLPLGAYPDRDLARIIETARRARELVLAGVDPRGDR